MANQKRKFTDLELSYFCNQLTMILAAGISTNEGLTMMLDDTKDPEERQILSTIIDELDNGSDLETAFAKTGLFPAYFLQMVRIGEETGKSEDVFISLSLHYQREDSIRTSIRHALIYPLIMIGMMFVVVLILLMKVLPIFHQVYAQLGTEMTGFAGALLSLGNLLSRYALLLFLLLILCLACSFLLVKKHLHQFPLTKDLYAKISSCHFASGMALALSSGLHPDRAMELVCDLNEDVHFGKKLAHCKTLIANGTDLSKAFFESGIFTGLHARMASIGEKSGTMDQVMEQISSAYQEEIDTKIDQLLSIIEPTLVIVLSLVVGIILMSVMLPLMGILSNL